MIGIEGKFTPFRNCPKVEQIERWENVARVLREMPAHDREHHWNMETFGELTECGTVACAAGHCGLDPWFRARGWALDFEPCTCEACKADPNGNLYQRLPDPRDFFGTLGAEGIFYNSTRRSVEAVLFEVETYLQLLRGA